MLVQRKMIFYVLTNNDSFYFLFLFKYESFHDHRFDFICFYFRWMPFSHQVWKRRFVKSIENIERKTPTRSDIEKENNKCKNNKKCL